MAATAGGAGGSGSSGGAGLPNMISDVILRVASEDLKQCAQLTLMLVAAVGPGLLGPATTNPSSTSGGPACVGPSRPARAHVLNQAQAELVAGVLVTMVSELGDAVLGALVLKVSPWLGLCYSNARWVCAMVCAVMQQ